MNNSSSVIITISSCLTHKLKNYGWINSHLLAISGFIFFFAPKYLLKMSAWQWVTKSSICRSTSSRRRDVLCGKHFSSTEGSSSWKPNIFTDSLASSLLILPQSMRFHEKEKAVTWALRERNSPSLSPLWMYQWMVEAADHWVTQTWFQILTMQPTSWTSPCISCLEFEPHKFHF